MNRTLTREEAKLITRRRLLEAAARILREEGLAALTTGRVARDAGVAQPTFYVHFKDMDALLEALADEKMAEVRVALRAARRRLAEAEGEGALRETFRLPLRAFIEQPDLWRLFYQEQNRPQSPLGRVAREIQSEMHRDLVEDLIAMGAPAATAEERERVEMVADSLIVLTQNFGMAYIDGRYRDLEKIVDLLVQYAYAVAPPTIARSAPSGSPSSTTSSAPSSASGNTPSSTTSSTPS
ncbi:MAG TPA: TetR/AcrR family transcriptional regulator [Candidatus Binatia bacterium]